MSAVPAIGLNDGHSIPQLGFGVFQVPPPDTEAATTTALGAGYRHIDTAEMYGNERGVGDAVRAAGLDRVGGLHHEQAEQWLPRARRLRAARSTRRSRRSASTTSTCSSSTGPCRRSTTATSSRRGRRSRSSSRTAGRGRSASRTSRSRISSASPPKADVVPAVNQVELHPYFQNQEVDAYGKAHGIVTEAWSPIAQGKVLGDPTLTEIAGRIGKSISAGRPPLAHPARATSSSRSR